MWAWALDVARLVGLEQVMGSETSHRDLQAHARGHRGRGGSLMA